MFPENTPIPSEHRNALSGILNSLNRDQSLWLSGYLAGKLSSVDNLAAVSTKESPATINHGGNVPLTILFGTESGNSEALAEEAKIKATSLGFQPRVLDMADCQPESLSSVENLLVIVSTWGDGEPPDRAAPFHKALMGDSAPALKSLRYSVLALGDTSYSKFCQTGKDFDQRLDQLGARRFHPRADCDVDYEDGFNKWLNGALEELGSLVKPDAPVAGMEVSVDSSPAQPFISYGKKHPFPSTLKERILLNGRGSAKETIHLEFSLAGSGMTYEPGDALAVIPANNKRFIDAVIEAGHFDPEEKVPLADGSEAPLYQALVKQYDITCLTKNVLRKYNHFAQSSRIEELLVPEKAEELKTYLHGREIVDMLADFPVKGLSGRDFSSILRKMPPRLYSISSSLKAHPDEVHLTVAVVRYRSHDRDREGVCSSFLCDRVGVGETVPIYTHRNSNFKLPATGDTPIIMVGPGTGIAPFRSFVEERAALGSKGPNWLIFGDQKYTYDFLYQLEWQKYLKDGVLNRLDLAFSRDQPEKIYVQDRMREQGKLLYSWLEEGAHLYVCGDAYRMAADVNDALIDVVQKQGQLKREQALEYVQKLQKEKRYQRDVY